MTSELPPEVTALSDAYVSGLTDALGDNLLGVYTRGSLALGGFDPEYSDIDLLVVTRNRITDKEFDALRLLHEQIRTRRDRFSQSLEVGYLDAASAHRFQPGEEHVTITSHDPLRWERHDTNWVLDRWQAREHGKALFGPHPHKVFDLVSEEELREATRERVIGWARWADDVPAEDVDWLNERAHQAYVIETMCRGLYALEHPGLPTKAEAVAWASGVLAEPWRTLLERSRDWRMDETIDKKTAEETLGFIRWAASKAEGV